MNIGYIHVSPNKQTTILPDDAVEKKQCERVFQGEGDGSGTLGSGARLGNINGRSL